MNGSQEEKGRRRGEVNRQPSLRQSSRSMEDLKITTQTGHKKVGLIYFHGIITFIVLYCITKHDTILHPIMILLWSISLYYMLFYMHITEL